MVVSTIPLQISSGKALNISNERLHDHKVLSVNNDKIVINFLSRLTNYQYPLQSRIRTIIFDDEQYTRYRFRPKTLSFDLYGSIELATAILRLNGCASIIDFDLTKVKVYNELIANDLIEILNKERSKIILNNDEVNKDIAEKIYE